MADSLISQFRREYNSPIETTRQVATINDRDSISTLRRWEGMLVYVVTEGVTYVLTGGTDNTYWVPLVGIQDAPIDGEYYVRKDGIWDILPSGLPDAPSDGETYGRKNGEWDIIDIAPSVGTFPLILEATGGSITYSVTGNGDYYRIGNMVNIRIALTNINSTGTAGGVYRLTGLPFVAGSGIHYLNLGRFSGMGAAAGVVCYVNGTETFISFGSNNATAVSVNADEVTGGNIYISGIYIAQ